MTLESARERLDACRHDWGVSVESVLETETSLIAFGARNGEGVVIKVARAETAEWRSGDLVSAFQGAGVVRCLAKREGAVLLDRVSPGHDLRSLVQHGRDDEATAILAGIIARMATAALETTNVGLMKYAEPADTLIREFQLYRHHGDGLMPAAMIEKAERIFAELCASQTDVGIRHGDLHHYNVLFDSRDGWVAIDPSGIHAELEYEVGASLRNPIDAPALLAQEQTVLRRLRIYEARLGLDSTRMLRWAFSQAVLAVLWPATGGAAVDARRSFVLAATAMSRLV